MLHCLQYNFEIRTNIFLAILENAVLYLDILVLIVYGTALGASSRKLGEQHFRKNLNFHFLEKDEDDCSLVHSKRCSTFEFIP